MRGNWFTKVYTVETEMPAEEEAKKKYATSWNSEWAWN